MNYREVEGDLIELALKGEFDVITHGVNCFCQMKAGIAPQMAKAFGCDCFRMEMPAERGNINKLGNIDYARVSQKLTVVNSYTQYRYGPNHKDGDKKPINYAALALCLEKINHTFKGKRIGLPKIGAGLAGGSWPVIKTIIQDSLVDCDVTVVIFNG